MGVGFLALHRVVLHGTKVASLFLRLFFLFAVVLASKFLLRLCGWVPPALNPEPVPSTSALLLLQKKNSHEEGKVMLLKIKQTPECL